MSDREPLAALLDRHEIEQCLLRYCRGMDRYDAELVRSAFHADARDDHGARIGSAHGLVDWANGVHTEAFSGIQHYVMNTTIDLDGDTAHAETYYMLAAVRKGTLDAHLGGGRYVDRFERRDGRWAIADRIVTHEWMNDAATQEVMAAVSVPPAQDRSDPSYRRPLHVDRDDRTVFGPGGPPQERAGLTLS
jgi:hypothetical protein